MALKKQDREYRLTRISYLDFKVVDMDRVLTNLFYRIHHKGHASRLKRKGDVTVEAIREELLIDQKEYFIGFEQEREVLYRWIETHLMDMVNRGKPNQAIAAPRPLHGFTYRFRNPRNCRDYGAAQQIYEMLYHAEGGLGLKAIGGLQKFFFQGVDPNTKMSVHGHPIDVETQALLRLSNQVTGDAADSSKPRESHPPVCPGSAGLLAEDVNRLLIYERFIPRSVMVDYIKILFGFHLALDLLRLMEVLPALVASKGQATLGKRRDYNDESASFADRLTLVVDVANKRGTHMASIAESSAESHLRRIPRFIRSYFITRKLHEFADNLRKLKKIGSRDFEKLDVPGILKLLGDGYKDERDRFFDMRITKLADEAAENTPVELTSAIDMELNPLETYIECIYGFRGQFHHKYTLSTLESLCLKNKDGALIAQERTRGAPRRFILDSRLLEVLLQLAVLSPGGSLGFHTKRIRIDELTQFLRSRYGIHIDRLPSGDGYDLPSIADRAALRGNLEAFKCRLREIGFFNDLSDAYVSQQISPRYVIDGEPKPEVSTS